MNCDDCQNRICESLDAGQSTRPDPAVDQHLSECLACREFHNAWAVLDAQLIRRAAKTTLPADFKETLLARLPAPQTRLTQAEIAARRAQFEAEYRAAMAALDRAYLFPRPATMLRILAVAGVCVLLGLLLAVLMRTLPLLIETALSQAGANPTTRLCGIIGLAAALYGLRRAWRPALRGLPLWWFRRFRFVPSLTRPRLTAR
jgi:predicted anti-sigma-YlaC factor YlaD